MKFTIKNSSKLFIVAFLIGFFLQINPTSSAAQMPKLDTKYQKLELKASKDAQLKLKDLRAQGVKENWTFQIGNTSVIDYIGKDIKALTGAQLPSAQKSSAPPSAGTADITKMMAQLPATVHGLTGSSSWW